MRAIIRCRTSRQVTVTDLEALFKPTQWWPNIPQDDAFVLERKEEVLATVAKSDWYLVEKTYQCIIYHSGTRSWAIVNMPNDQELDIRIRNPVSERLKKPVKNLLRTCKWPALNDPGRIIFTFLLKIL